MIVAPARFPNMARRLVQIAAVIAVPLLLAIVFLPTLGRHRIILKAYFSNAMGLRAGAPVRLAGVDIGSVKSVRAVPELKQFPVEAVLVLSPSYTLQIPNDATASLETEGVLGETYVDIDARSASGPPIGNGGTLRSIPVVQMSTEQIVQKATDAIGRIGSACKPNTDCSGAPPGTAQPRTLH
jgi:phospholipid/cholesterol/gamma-HCH transport system substrate-binding protein